MAPLLETVAPHFRADPRKSGGSLMRVFRDTRFSRDKTPHKTNIGIQFRHATGKDFASMAGARFAAATPFLRFLCDALAVEC